MTTGAKVKWTMEADYLQACNCDYGCPCEFQAPPTPRVLRRDWGLAHQPGDI